jgi:hypothetical protein
MTRRPVRLGAGAFAAPAAAGFLLGHQGRQHSGGIVAVVGPRWHAACLTSRRLRVMPLRSRCDRIPGPDRAAHARHERARAAGL